MNHLNMLKIKIKIFTINNMSLQTSRFHGQEIVNSFNIFVDSEKASLVGDRQSKGDDIQIHFAGQSIVGNDGENIRLSLLNFTMFNNTYMVNIKYFNFLYFYFLHIAVLLELIQHF